MTQYPGYEIERFENEGGNSSCYYRYFKPIELEMEKVPVIDIIEDEDPREEVTGDE